MKSIFHLIIIFIFLLFNAYPSVSQQTNWSLPEKINNRMINFEILGSWGANYYVVRYNKSLKQDFIFTRYNHELQIINSVEFQIDKGENIEEIFMMGNTVYLLYSIYNRENKEYQLFASTITERLTFGKKDVPLVTTKITPSNSKTFKITYDKVYHRFLIAYPSEIVNEIVRFNFSVFTSTLEQYKSMLTIVSARKEFSLEQLSLFSEYIGAIIRINDNRGNLFKSGQERLRFFAGNLIDQHSFSTDLFNDTLNTSSVVFKYDFQNKLFILSGFYSTSNNEVFQGISIFKISTTIDTSEKKFIPFSSEMITTLEGVGYKGKGLKDFYAARMLLRDDGGFVFMGEKFTVVKEVMNNYYSLNNTYIRYFYRFSDILIASVNQYGTIEWTKVIKKDQTTLNDEGYYSSFSSTGFKNKIVVLFNDISRSNWNLMYNTIDPEGNIDYSILINSSKINGNSIPKYARQVNAHEILIPVISESKGFSVLKLNFEKDQ